MRGETRFLGLYTHTAYAANPNEVPLLRRKLAAVMERAGLLPTGHSGKALASILESYPRDELLQISADDLQRHAMAILQLGERQRLRLLVRQDAYGRFVTCLIFVPRERYNTELRQRFQKILTEAFNGVSSDFDVDLSAAALGRILMRIRTEPGEMAGTPDLKALEARLVEAMRRWEDDLHAALLERHGEERANALFRIYEKAFPASYREEYSVREAVTDIEMIESLDPATDLGMNLHLRDGGRPGMLNFKIYRRGSSVPLSDSVPMLERLGVRVQYEHPHELEPAGAQPARVVDFGLVPPAGAEVDVAKVRDAFHDAFLGMCSGTVEADSLNRLVLTAGLSAREISVLRAYARYLRQGTSTFSLAYVEQALAAHPRIAALLVRLFFARFEGTGNGARSDAGRGDLRCAGRSAEPGRGPHPAQLPRRDPGHHAHQLLPEQAVPLVQARPEARARAARAAADVRDLGVLAARRRRAPARRARGARRPALVGPHGGLPHRGAGPDEGADGEERGDRPGRRQGRLRGEARRRRSARRS